MKVIQLQDVLHEYLVHVLEEYKFHPTEGVAASHLWEAVTKRVQHFDDQQVRAAATAGAPQEQSPVVPPADDLKVQDQAYSGSGEQDNG